MLSWLTVFLLPLVECSFPGPSAEAVAGRAVPRVLEAMDHSNWLSYRNFGSWSYEGGAISRGLWEILAAFPDTDLEEHLHHHLNHFLEDPSEFGFRILNNESLTYNDSSNLLPWLYSIGDNIGLFPIAYTDRLQHATLHDWYDADEDRYVVSEVVEKYIYGYPWHLPDGTISRPLSWFSEGFLDPHGLTVWVDDTFMGTALLVAWARLTGEVRHLDYAAKQVLHLTDYLSRDEGGDGLLHHGFNYWTGHMSCCKWARGNGWAFIAITEVLSASESLGVPQPEVLSLYQRQATGLLAVQGQDGGWHNILNNNSTFTETSSTAMFLTGLARGLRHGWLEQEDSVVQEVVARAWQKVSSNVLADGSMLDIIGGTGIQDREDQYSPDSTEYSHASPGVGAVLRAVAEVATLQALQPI